MQISDEHYIAGLRDQIRALDHQLQKYEADPAGLSTEYDLIAAKCKECDAKISSKSATLHRLANKSQTLPSPTRKSTMLRKLIMTRFAVTLAEYGKSEQSLRREISELSERLQSQTVYLINMNSGDRACEESGKRAATWAERLKKAVSRRKVQQMLEGEEEEVQKAAETLRKRECAAVGRIQRAWRRWRSSKRNDIKRSAA